MGQLRIGGLAKRTGLTPATIRYYERIGLLAESARTSAGYRVYSEAARVELAFARRAQGFGFTLEEIREILHIHRRGLSPCERLVSAARCRLEAVDHEVEELTRFRSYLAGQIASWTSCDDARSLSGPCALIECKDALCDPIRRSPPRVLTRKPRRARQ